MRDQDASSWPEGLDHVANDNDELLLPGLPAEIDGFFLGNELDIASNIGHQPVGGQVLRFAQGVQITDGFPDALKGRVGAELNASPQCQHVAE